MRSKISSVIAYTSLLLKKYNELQQSRENNIYRIVEIKQLGSNQNKIIVQVINKSSIIECSPREIVAIDWFLEGFSKKDIRTITYLACKQINNPKYKIISQDFCDQFNRIIFKLREAENNASMRKTAAEIIMDKHLLNNLSKEDINSISYIAGYECSQNKI